MIVVIDSGVWISALGFGGTPRLAVEKVVAIDRIAICDLIQNEVARVLVEKIGWDQSRVEEDLMAYLEGAIWVPISRKLHGVCRDPKDDMVIECAVNAKAELIVSGDKDLLVLRKYKDIKIISPYAYATEQRPTS